MTKVLSIYSSLFLKLITLLIGILILRWLNSNLIPSELAVFNLLITLITVLLSFSTLGITPIINRLYTSQNNTNTDSKDYESLWTLHFILQSIFILFCLFILIFVQFYFLPNFAYYLVFTLFIAQSIFAIDGNYKVIADFTGKSWIFVSTELLTKFLLLVLLYSYNQIYNLNSKLEYYIFCILIVSLTQLILDYYFFGKQIKFKKVDFSIFKKYKLEILQFFTITFMYGISNYTDRFVLKLYNVNDFQFNGYINVYKLLDLSLVMESILYPPILYKMIANRDIDGSWKKLLTDNNWLKLYIFSSIIIFLGFIFSILIILKVIDKDMLYYSESLKVAPILALIPLITGLNSLISFMFIYKKLQYIEIYSLVIFVIVSLSLYFILIPRYQIIGAAIASTTSTMVLIASKLIFYYYHKSKYKKI